MPKYIGIDPSLSACAVCVLDGDGTHEVKLFAAKPPIGRAFFHREDRYKAISIGVEDFIFSNMPEGFKHVLIEGYGAGARGNSQIPMIEFGFCLRSRLTNSACGLIEVPPACLKKFVTGKGNADKSAMILGVYKRWGVEFTSNDEADAYSLARLAQAYETGKCDNEKQREVIAVLKGEK